MTTRLGARASSFVIASVIFGAGCFGHQESTRTDPEKGRGSGGGGGTPPAFVVNPLVSDLATLAPRVDPNLINAWGLVSYDETFWIADNGTGKISVYDGAGNPAEGDGKIMLEEGITGIAVNETDKFVMRSGDKCAAATLIVASESGKIWGVNPDVSFTGFVLIDRSDVQANYKGVAVIRGADGAPLLLAADFHNGRIDVFDGYLRLVTHVSFVLQHPVEGFAPFNVMFFKHTVFVAYAKQDEDREDEVRGEGLGILAAFDVSGNQKFAITGQTLNAPWGMAMSPCDFGPFANVLLVGNFGDGRINAVDPVRGTLLGQLLDADGMPIFVDGLWGLAFGNDVENAIRHGLYFAAGPNDEDDGLFGVIELADAQTAVTTAEGNLVTAEFQLATAWAQLHRATAPW